jgi:hypothetical protein
VISNTGHKGIHWRESRGVFQVIVQWRGKMLWGTADSLTQAVGLRNRLECALGKPRTERRILPDAQGICQTTSGRREARREVVQAHVAPSPGKRRTTTYQYRDDEELADALFLARRWRARMEKQYYF